MLDQIFGRLFFEPVDRICGSDDFAGWPFRGEAGRRETQPRVGRCLAAIALCVGGLRRLACQLSGGNSGRHTVLERFVFPILIAILIAIITDIDTARWFYFAG
jgi:hypothetical protein